MKPKVLVTVEGGIVQSIDANMDMDIIVVDYDKQSDDPVLIDGPKAPDSIFLDGESFMLIDNPASQAELTTRQHLIDHKF